MNIYLVSALVFAAGFITAIVIDFSFNAVELDKTKKELKQVDADAKAYAKITEEKMKAWYKDVEADAYSKSRRISNDVDGIRLLNKQIDEYKKRFTDADAIENAVKDIVALKTQIEELNKSEKMYAEMLESSRHTAEMLQEELDEFHKQATASVA